MSPFWNRIDCAGNIGLLGQKFSTLGQLQGHHQLPEFCTSKWVQNSGKIFLNFWVQKVGNLHMNIFVILVVKLSNLEIVKLVRGRGYSSSNIYFYTYIKGIFIAFYRKITCLVFDVDSNFKKSLSLHAINTLKLRLNLGKITSNIFID